MIWAVLGWVALAGFLTVLAGLVTWLLMRRCRAEAVNDESWEFLPENYHALNGLFAEEDIEFLQTRRGYQPQMGRRWRRERCDLFRLYLEELKADFWRLHARARRLAAHSDAESAPLIGVLIRQELTFVRALAGVEIRFLLYRTGVGSINIAPFIELIETMRLDLDARFASQAV